MHVVANPAGRLVTFLVTRPISDESSEAASMLLRSHVVAIAGPVVVVSDLRDGRTLSPAMAERFVAVMRADNPKIERSALLVSDASPTYALQLTRMVNESASASRRIFTDPRELVAWLRPVLGPPEQAALDAFLDDPPLPSPSRGTGA